MQKEIDELLRRHSALTPLERCGFHWVPENKSLDWYLGFLQTLEICEGIRQLFTEEKQPEAYAILQKRVREELTNLQKTKAIEERDFMFMKVVFGTPDGGSCHPDLYRGFYTWALLQRR